MSQADLHIMKWDGKARSFQSFHRNFRSDLAMKKILWTIQDNDIIPTKPRTSYGRIKNDDGTATDQDYRSVEKYEKLKKDRKEDCEQAISILEKSIGSVPRDRIDDILSSDRAPRKKIKASYDKLVSIYATNNTILIEQIENEFELLPVANSAKEVIDLLDKMISLNADIRQIDRTAVWTSTNLNKFLRKRVRLPEFVACKDRCTLAGADFATTEAEYRLVAESESITLHVAREESSKPKRQDGLAVQEFTSNISAALVNPSMSTRSCWNCNQTGHYIKECKLGMCRNCSMKGMKSNHSPADCPNYVPKSRDRTRDQRSHLNTIGLKDRLQGKINAVTEEEDEHKDKRLRVENEDLSKETLWDKIKSNVDYSSGDNYSTDYPHPLDIIISEDTAKLICITIMSYNTLPITTNDRVLLDSGASISLCNMETSSKFSFKVYQLRRPIPLKFGNSSTGYSRSWCDGGPLLGAIYIVSGLAMTLISTTELARRHIIFFNAKKSFGLLDKDYDIILTKPTDCNNKLPVMDMQELLNTEISQRSFHKFTVKSDKYLHDYACINNNVSAVQVKKSSISKEQYLQVIALHERMFHANPSVMASAIRNYAWTGVDIEPTLINKVFRHYDCEACAKAKRNKEATQIGTQIPVTTIGTCLSVDRVPVNTSDLAGHTGYYTFIDEAKGYLLVFLDKTYDLVGYIEKVRLFYQRHGSTVRRIRFDAGSVENSDKVMAYLSRPEVRIDPQPASVNQQNQNVVERYIQHLGNVVSACMEGADEVTPAFWGLCVLGFATIYNYTPNTASGQYSPHYHLTNKHPDLSETCKFPFGQLVTVAKTTQELRGTFKFATKNDIGLAVGSVTYNNKSTFVYIPSHTGAKMVFPRMNVRAINSAPVEWTQEGALPDTTTQNKHPLVVIDPSEGVLLTRVNNNIDLDETIIQSQVVSNPIQDGSIDINARIPTRNNDEGESPLRTLMNAEQLMETEPVQQLVNEEEHLQDIIDEGETNQVQNNIAPIRQKVRMITHPAFPDISGEELNDDEEEEPPQRQKIRMLTRPKYREPSGEDLVLHTVRVRRPSAKLIGVVEEAICIFAVQATDPSLFNCSNFPTLKEALASGQRIMWIKAIETEFATLKELDTYELIDYKDIPNGANIIPTKFVLRVKVTSTGEYIKHKARLVVLGCRDKMVISDLFAPTASSKSVSLIICLVVALGLFMCGLDIYGAFLIPEIKRNVYVELPKVLCGNKPVFWKLKRTLYGLADSPIEFYKHVSATLIESGYKCTISDPCVFIKRENATRYVIAVIYVDDFIVAGTNMDLIDQLKSDLRKKYTITESPNLESFIGIHLTHNKNGSVTISQPGFIKGLLEEYEMLDAVKALTPMSSTFSDEYQDDSNMLDAENKQKYMSILGSLIFLLRTRPDIAYAVNRMATRTCRATIKDMYALGRILKYLAGTVDLGLRFNPSQREDLTTIFCHVDAAYACHIDGKSHSGYCFSLGSHHTGKFYCRSAKQANVTTSSTEAECDALKEAAKEIEWMRFMMEELGFPQTEPTQIYEDNKSTIVLATKFSGNMKRVKHMMQTIHYILDLYQRSVIKLSHIDTQDQIADMLTKPLPSEIFLKLRALLMGE